MGCFIHFGRKIVKYRWPILDVYGVPDSKALINKCLETLHGLTLMEQFMARTVVAIYGRPMLVAGGLVCLNGGGFVIYFDSETQNTADVCITIAHELGHTFEHRPETFKQFLKKRSAKYIDASEDFAEAFAYRWLTDVKIATELRIFIDRHFVSSEEHQYIDLKSLGYS